MKLVGLKLLLVVFLIAVGCGQTCGEMAYDNVVNKQMETFEHTSEPAKIWASARPLLRAKGADFPAEPPPTTAAILNDWDAPEGGDRKRWSVWIRPHDGGHVLEVTRYEDQKRRVQENVPGQTARQVTGYRIEHIERREHELEWKVAQALEPAKAAEIDRAAQAREEIVRDVVSSGCQ